MAKTTLSILTQENWLEDQLLFCVKKSNYTVGFHGQKEDAFLTFLDQNKVVDHVLLIKPSSQYSMALDEAELRKTAKIDVIVVGSHIPEEHIPLIQRSNVSGYLSYSDLFPKTINDLIPHLQKHGYFPNRQIPLEYWKKRPKQLQDYRSPQFTPTEKTVLFHLCHGFTRTEISELMDTSTSNVQNHLTRIKQKALVNSTMELAIIGVANSWVRIKRSHFKRHNPFIKKQTM
ncbi:MAG: helix-turn-helix transcriptional regulator [Salibacteraceae bacterium]